MTASAPPHGTVLVVEDEPAVRELVVAVLKELGFLPLEAAAGLAGLNILRAAPKIDLLIADIGLPDINGREMAAQARSLRPGLKILFMTGHAAAGDALEPGMALISKPFPLDALAAQVTRMIEEKASLCEQKEAKKLF